MTNPAPGASDHTRRIGFFTTDLELVVKSWDATLERMTGLAAEPTIGRALDQLIPDLRQRGLIDVMREPLISGAAQVLAPALHKFLIPCPPIDPSDEFDRMQQRVIVGALRDNDRTVGLVVTIEDVTGRVEEEHRLARRLRDVDPAARLAAVEELSHLTAPDGPDPLGEALTDDHWQVRRAAVHALAARTDPGLVPTIVKALRDGHRDFSLLSSALQLLNLTGVDIRPALTELLTDPDADLRVQAVLALGMQPAAGDSDALLAALDDQDANVRFHAIEALGTARSAAAIERLLAIAASHDFFLAFPAIEALARIGEPAVAPSLVPLLVDPMLRLAAADALAQIGDEDTIPPLVEALSVEQAPAAMLVAAIAAIHRRHEQRFGDATVIEDLVKSRIKAAAVTRLIETLERAEGEGLRSVVVVLGWLRSHAVASALARLLGRAEINHAVVEALVRFGSPAVELLIAQLVRDDEETRHAAVVALGRIGDRRAVPALLSLLDQRSRPLWVPIAGALARLGDARAFEPLLGLLGDEDAAVRQAAIGALNSIGHPEMGPRMEQLLGDVEPRRRESAVRIAGYFGYPGCVDALLQRCADPEEGVRIAALEHLPFLADARAPDALSRALQGDTPRARAAAARALGDIELAAALPLLERAAADADDWVRYFAAISLGRLRDRATLPILLPLATSDPARQVRAAALETVGLVDGAAALPVLGDLAGGTDDDLADVALRALGGVRDAAARRPVQAALRHANPRRRLAAVAAIVRWAGEDSVNLLSWTAASDADAAVVAAATSGLGSLAAQPAPVGKQAVEALVAALSNASHREAALTALVTITPAAIPWLAQVLDAGDPDTRRNVVEALGRMSHSSASACLQRALEDGDAAVRRRAVAELARLGTRGIAQRLAHIACSDVSPLVREAAAQAIGRDAAAQAIGRDATATGSPAGAEGDATR